MGKKYGIRFEKMTSLAADCKELTLMLDEIRDKYGVACIDISVYEGTRGYITVHEKVVGDEMVEGTLTGIRIGEDTIEIEEPTLFNHNREIIKKSDNPFQE